MFRKVTRRWLINGLSAVVALLLIIEVAAAFLIRSYYYQQAQNSLYTRAVSLSDRLRLSLGDDGFSFEENARAYVESFAERDKMEFQVLSADGKILASSTGFLPQADKTLDYRAATQMVSEEKYRWGVWDGKNAVGQNVLALTMLVTKTDGTVCGAIRYLVALDNVDNQITLIISAMVTFGLAILFFVLLCSSYFVNSLLRPLTEISTAANKIAQGDYSHRIKKQYNDEIGDLCDTINEMASHIESADKLQNEFISSISHELRTPLTAIKGWSETLKDGTEQDPELLSRGLEVISGEAERLSGIVEELLDFSRIQATKEVDMTQEVDVYEQLQKAVFLLKDRARKQGIHLTCTEQETLPTVRGNGDRLCQVFVNVIENAVKYSKPNGTVHVDAASVNGAAQVVVSDDGIGISAEDLPYVTERFYRASNAQPGSGIGLAVALEIVTAHGGTLQIESEPDHGTVVTIRLGGKHA